MQEKTYLNWLSYRANWQRLRFNLCDLIIGAESVCFRPGLPCRIYWEEWTITEISDNIRAELESKTMQCFGCGVEKDTEVLERYPLDKYPEDPICDDPICPLFVLEVQPNQPVLDSSTWKAAVVCHECFHKLEPDLWIGENCWRGISPVIPFDKLPRLLTDQKQKLEPLNYRN